MSLESNSKKSTVGFLNSFACLNSPQASFNTSSTNFEHYSNFDLLSAFPSTNPSSFQSRKPRVLAKGHLIKSLLQTITMSKEEKCLEVLRHRVERNPDLDDFSSVFTDKFLLHFVRGRKYNADKAYETLVGYMNIRSGKYKDWFKSMRPSNFHRIPINPMRVLKHRDHLNRLVVLIEFKYWKPRDLPMDEALKLVMLDIDEFMNYEDAEKNGVVAIYDFTDYNFQHARCITPNAMHNAIQICWKNVPLSYKAFHMVNEMYLFTMLFKVIKPILPAKLKDRIYFHSNDYDSLHESVPAEVLPESLGGLLSNDEAFDEKYYDNILNKDHYYEMFRKLL